MSLSRLLSHLGVSSSSFVPLVNFGCGVVAGILASLATQPADVIKTHMQVNPALYPRTSDAVRFVYAVSIKGQVIYLQFASCRRWRR